MNHVIPVQLGGGVRDLQTAASRPPAPSALRYRIEPVPLQSQLEAPPPGASGVPGSSRGYIRKSWIDSHHRADGNSHLRFPVWKKIAGPIVDRLLEARDTRVLGAFASPPYQLVDHHGGDRGPVMLGWIVWTPGRSISTVHYAYVRHSMGDPAIRPRDRNVLVRRRGIFASLLEEAGIGARLAYTYRGEIDRKAKANADGHHPGLDEALVGWLRERGVTAVYEPVERWLA